jgi:2-dehydro-3-deoxygalactonokinase
MVDAIYKLEVVSLPGRRVYLVPGVSHRTQQGWDVMRGEETQLLGAMALTGMDSGWFCLPGTHAKWVHVEGGQLLSFSTHMTGEAHALFSQHGLLGRWMTSTEQEDSPEAFAQGVAIAQTPGGLLHHLFHTRTRSLDGELPVSHQRAFLSGLLIGHEVRHMTKGRPVECVTLVGQSRLTRLYALACQQLSWPSREVEGERAVACGLAWMARNREGLSR